MTDVLAFWGVCLLFAALALPLAFALLRRLPDAGAGMSFALGLVVAGYLYFILRVAAVLPQGRGGYLLALGLLALLSAAVAGRDRRFASTLRRTAPLIVAMAGLFTVAFFLYVAFRSYQPDISGTEQPMDFLYLNATLESKDYPPEDPWLAGKPASYYYFGYLQVGVLTATAGVPASTGYNLGLAYTFAAAATGMASLAFALGRWVFGARGRRWALATAAVALFLLLGLGSLSAVFEFAAAHERYNSTLYEAFGLDSLLPCAPGAATTPATPDCYAGPQPRTTSWYPTEHWFWFRGTRVIPGAITEFPFFSFLLGDLHPHVMSIPLVLLSLGLAAATWRARGPLSFATHRRSPWPGLALGVIFGGLAFENAWDALTFSGVLAVAVAARNLRSPPIAAALRGTLTYLMPIAAVAVAAYLPWYRDFGSQVGGLFPYTGAGTRPAHAFLQFGPLLLCAVLGLGWLALRRDLALVRSSALGAVLVPVVPLVAWAFHAQWRGDFGAAIDARGSGWVTLAAYGAITALLTGAFTALATRRHPAALPLGLAALGALLLYGSELFYIKDIFVRDIPRLNTVFKLSYQAWIVLAAGGSVALAAAIKRSWEANRPIDWLAAPIAGLVLLGAVYPVTALANRTGGFGNETAVDGLASVARNDPAEYALILWVGQHLEPGDVIIEGTGRTWRRDSTTGQPLLANPQPGVDYSDGGRVSARTGQPTPIGWYFHEIQWRGDSAANRAEFRARQDMVDSLYTGHDAATALDVLARTGARYVVVGRLEQSLYPPDLMPDFASFLEIAFESGGLRVYRLGRYEVVATS